MLVCALCFYVLCLIYLLVNFERIDGLMQLCADVQRLASQRNQVEELKNEMGSFWSAVQGQVDLWLHRTVPRLELIKEIQEQVSEGTPVDDLTSALDMMNGRFQQLEDQIGDLTQWKHGGPSEEAKRVVGETIRTACRGATSMKQIMANLDDVLADGIPRALENGSANGNARGSPNGNPH
jgi:hypothetical protein